MSESRVTSEVEVATDPLTAFGAFTAELDLWWIRGPINFHNAARAVAMRCEPGVGGRVLEIYDEVTGDMLELARITAWEPGARLAWTSSIDDVEIDIGFAPSSGGTTVTVVASIPVDGSDRGGTAWVRVLRFFGTWCARRNAARREPDEIARLALGVHYERPLAAARWLTEVFGLELVGTLPDEADGDDGGEPPWLEFRVGVGSLMLFSFEGEGRGQGAPSHVPWLYVDDVEAHFDHVRAAGATIVEELHDVWGLPFYVADDLEGNRWTIAQARPTMR